MFGHNCAKAAIWNRANPCPIHFFLMESKDANFLTHEEPS